MINKNKISGLLLCIITMMVLMNLAACKKLTSFDNPPSVGTSYDVISADNIFSSFRYAVDKAGLVDVLNGATEYTIFAPTNTALINAGYPLSTLQTMLNADVAVLVKNHIVAGKIDVTTLGASMDQTALSGLKITIQNTGKLTFANGGDVLNTNQPTSNGYLNVINTALASKATLIDAINIYANATANSQLTFLAAAIARASTGSTNFTNILTGANPYTLFAPNNGAFIDAGYATIAAINTTAPDVLGSILKYHLITGAKLTTAFDSTTITSFSGTPIYFDMVTRNPGPTITLATNVTLWYANGIVFGNVGSPNIVAKNGVMHTISRFLSTPVTTTTLSRIQTDPTLSMFYALILKASTADPAFNFQNLLSNPVNSYTVFAVNNAGLQAEGYADVAAINAEQPAVLAKILKLHLILKRQNNINIPENGTFNSLLLVNGVYAPLTFNITTGYKVKGPSNATSIPVITANVVTTNGLLNIIGGVLK